MFEIYFTAAVIFLATVLLIFEVTRPAYILLTALFLLFLGGVVSLDDTLAGFSNQGMITIAILYVIAATLQSSSGFIYLVDKILGSSSRKGIYLRLMLLVSFLSAFMNNTPVVAALIPSVRRWVKRNSFPASKLMIPLSYAAILGGMCTLIGSSTNLIVHGLLLDKGQDGFDFFEIGKVGLPVAIFIILYFSLLGHKLLPIRRDSFSRMTESSREYMVEVKIGKDFPHAGKSIEDANLRHLKGLYLFQIIRDETEIAPVGPGELILHNDRLFFTGMPDTIFEMVKTPGFQLVKDLEIDIQNIDSDKHKTYEAVVSNISPLVGESVRESGFRTRYNAVILAIHRNGERIKQKVGEIEFQANDTLFILADKQFEKKWFHSSDFSLVSESVKEYSKPKLKGNFALLSISLMIVMVASGIIESMLVAAAVTAGLLLLTKVISYHDAKNSIDTQVLLVIVAALGLGKGIYNSGIAEIMADWMINLLMPFGSIAVIAGIFFLTSFYTEIITNNAAAAIVFPLAWASAQKMGISPEPFMITLAIAASSSFATPVGYQTNLMVFGPGGYKFIDYFKTGAVINLLVGVITILIVHWIYFVTQA